MLNLIGLDALERHLVRVRVGVKMIASTLQPFSQELGAARARSHVNRTRMLGSAVTAFGLELPSPIHAL